MDYSFYGGRRGASFIVSGRFRFISAADISEREEEFILDEIGPDKEAKTRAEWIALNCMVEAFHQGDQYTVVKYEEYAIIDTFNKNNPDNGKLFKRGLSYADAMGGAKYIGQIVGPSGGAPSLGMTSIEEIEQLRNHIEQDRFDEGNYNVPAGSLVPGKTSTGEFNDVISWASCSLINRDGEVSAYLGFKFPYHVQEFVSEKVSPYQTGSLVSRVDDESHPFFSKWKIKIPQGIKGDSFKNLRIQTLGSNGRLVIAYDKYDYTNSNEGESSEVLLGAYNIIDNVSLDDDGTLTVTYTFDDPTIYSKKIKWITSVSLNDNGQFLVNFNDGTNYETSLKWINSVEMTDEGELSFHYNDNSDPVIIDNKIKWLTDVSLTASGTIQFTFNTGEPLILNHQIKWIKKVSLSDSGTLAVEYNNGAVDEWSNKITWIDSVNFTDDGLLTINYNNDKPPLTKLIKWISNVSIDTGAVEGQGSQKVMVQYNDGNPPQKIGEPLNYIMKTALRTEDYHLLVLYSDPLKRGNVTYLGRNDWYDLGCIKSSDNGLFIAKHYDLSAFNSSANSVIIEELNRLMPSGLSGGDAGKIISVGDPDEGKMLFAFNYDTSGGKYKGWYFLGSTTPQPDPVKIQMCVAVGGDNQAMSTNIQKLPIGSLWFVLDDNSISYPVTEIYENPPIYDKLCVLVSSMENPKFTNVWNNLRTGSVWFVVTEE